MQWLGRACYMAVLCAVKRLISVGYARSTASAASGPMPGAEAEHVMLSSSIVRRSTT